MADSTEREVVRMTWDEWLASRAAKRAALEAKGLAAPSRRATARPEAREALCAFVEGRGADAGFSMKVKE